MKKKILNLALLISITVILFSCKKNYVSYYNKVNEIDSIYRIANQPKNAINQYRNLFRNYPPKNQERIEEYLTFIKLSDQHNEDFGGKKSLYNLLYLIAPYGEEYKKHLPLFNKYGINNQSVSVEIRKWKDGLNTALIDSFKIALKRDQQGRHQDTALVRKNAKKNAEFFIWTLKNYGFPTSQKIGWFPMSTFISHLSECKEYYPYLKEKIRENVISGECSPQDYARMVDTELGFREKKSLYGFNLVPITDSARVNRNRKSIGIPSLKHSVRIRKDKFGKFNTDDTHYIQ